MHLWWYDIYLIWRSLMLIFSIFIEDWCQFNYLLDIHEKPWEWHGRTEGPTSTQLWEQGKLRLDDCCRCMQWPSIWKVRRTRNEKENMTKYVFLAASSRWRWRMSTSTSRCGARRSTPPSWRRGRWRRWSWRWRPLITTVPPTSEMFVNIQYPDRIRPSLLTSRESLATLDHCGRSK